MTECEYPDCRSRGQVARYCVEYPEGLIRVKLCRRHARPLIAFARELRRRPEARRKFDRGKVTRPVDIDLL